MKLNLLHCIYHLSLLYIFLISQNHVTNSTKIIFGSCSKVNEPQPLWKIISSRKPELFAWLGDNVYADVRRSDFYKNPNIFSGKGKESLLPGDRPRFTHRTKEEHEAMYVKQKNIPDYKILSKQTEIIGTWDDHDCGINDADKFFKLKNERMHLHLDFLNVPKDDPRRIREGVYTSHIVGRMKIILLDVRYNRDPWKWHAGVETTKFEQSDILGKEQWAWLKDQLTVTDVDNIDLILVGSGIQVLPIVGMASEKHETWVHFANSRNRFISLLSASKSPVILLSGDVHFAEMSEMVCTNKSNMNGEKHHRVLEFTSSGLTHAWAGPLNWPKPMPAPLLFRSFYYLWAMIGIHPWRVHAYPGLNFGEIEMSDDKHVIMRAIGVDNKTKFEMKVKLNELIGGSSNGNNDIICEPLHGNPSNTRIQLSNFLFFGILIIIFSSFSIYLIRFVWKVVYNICCRSIYTKGKKE